MFKIYIDPGHGGSDPGSQGNGLLEKNLTLPIAIKIRDILIDEYEDVSVRLSRTKDQTVSLSERTDDANAWGADFYLSVHINAGGGVGYEDYVFPDVGRPTTTYQQNIHEEVLRATNFDDRGSKQANFHVLRETSMPAVLTENGFIDNNADAAKLKSISFRESIARGHVNAIVRSFNLKRKTNNQDGDFLYLVQIGAFNDRRNAVVISNRAKNRGFETFIFQDKGLYKVQIGAFSQKENAERLATEARDKGFDVFINRN